MEQEPDNRIGGTVIGHSCVGGGEIYRLDYDPARGFLHAVGSGFWAPDDADAYCAALNRFVFRAHADHGRLRFLVDRRGCPVQVPEVPMRIRAAMAETLDERDRAALVVDSALVRLQMQRVVIRPRFRVFENMNEAVEWLFRDD